MGQVHSKESLCYSERIRLALASDSDSDPKGPVNNGALARKRAEQSTRPHTSDSERIPSLERLSQALESLVEAHRIDNELAARLMETHRRLHAGINGSGNFARRTSRVAFDVLRGGSVNLCAVESLQQLTSRMTLSMRCVPDVLDEEKAHANANANANEAQAVDSETAEESVRWNADRKIYFYRTNFVLHPLTETICDSVTPQENQTVGSHFQLNTYRLSYLFVMDPETGDADLANEKRTLEKLVAAQLFAQPSSPVGQLIPVLSDAALKYYSNKYPSNSLQVCCARFVHDSSSARIFIGLSPLLKLMVLIRLAFTLDHLHKRIQKCIQMGIRIPYDFVTCASIILQYVKACCIAFHIFSYTSNSESESTTGNRSSESQGQSLDSTLNRLVDEEVRDIGEDVLRVLSHLLRRDVGWSSELFLTGICTLCTDWAHLMPPQWVDRLRALSDSMTPTSSTATTSVLAELNEGHSESESESKSVGSEQLGARLVAADRNWWRPSDEANVASRVLWLTALCAAQLEVLQRARSVMHEEYRYLSRHMPYIAYVIVPGQLRSLLEMALRSEAAGNPKLLDQWLVLLKQVLAITLRMTQRGLKTRRPHAPTGTGTRTSSWWNSLGWNDRFTMELGYNTRWSGFQMVDQDKIDFVPRINLIDTLRILRDTVVSGHRFHSQKAHSYFFDTLNFYKRVFNGELPIERQFSDRVLSDANDDVDDDATRHPAVIPRSFDVMKEPLRDISEFFDKLEQNSIKPRTGSIPKPKIAKALGSHERAINCKPLEHRVISSEDLTPSDETTATSTSNASRFGLREGWNVSTSGGSGSDSAAARIWGQEPKIEQLSDVPEHYADRETAD